MKQFVKFLSITVAFVWVHQIAAAQRKVWRTPNDFRYTAAKIFLRSGKSLEGMLSLDCSKVNEEFTFKPEEGTERTYSFYDINRFEINDKIYIKKKIDTAGTGLKYDERFVLIISETHTKLVLYQYDYLPADLKNPSAGMSATVAAKMYFVTVPNIDKENIVWVFSKKLVPDLDIKLATALKDLLPLATQIGMKDKGYFYDEKTPVNLVVKIWKTIVEEYNASN